MARFRQHEFRLVSGETTSFEARCEASCSDSWYEDLKRAVAMLQDDDEPVVCRGRAYAVYIARDGRAYLSVTDESGTGFADGSVVCGSSAPSVIEAFDSGLELREALRTRMDPRDPECPYSNLLTSWGYNDIVSDAAGEARYLDSLP